MKETSLCAKEQEVGNRGLLAGYVREAVNSDFLFNIRIASGDFVEVFKEAAVEEWDRFVQILNRVL